MSASNSVNNDISESNKRECQYVFKKFSFANDILEII